MRQFSYRINDLELRSCDERLLINDAPHTTADIVKWNTHNCYSIGYFVPTSDGFDFKSVGARIVQDEVDWLVLNILIKEGFILLESEQDD